MCFHLLLLLSNGFAVPLTFWWRLHSALRHPNIVLFMGAVTTREYCLVTELVPRGSLWAVLHSDAKLEWSHVLKLAIGTARGMAFLHSASPRPILHRDLKSGNLLVVRRFH